MRAWRTQSDHRRSLRTRTCIATVVVYEPRLRRCAAVGAAAVYPQRYRGGGATDSGGNVYRTGLSPTSHTCCDRPNLPCLACLTNAPATGIGGKPLSTKPSKSPIMFYAPPDLHDRIVDTAQECGTSVAGFCRTAVAAYLESLERGQ